MCACKNLECCLNRPRKGGRVLEVADKHSGVLPIEKGFWLWERETSLPLGQGQYIVRQIPQSESQRHVVNNF